LINRHHGTVSKEVKRNTGLRGYRPRQAQERFQQRHQDKPRSIKLTASVHSLIADTIGQEWSPVQVQGRLRSEGFSMVFATTIYRIIRKTKRRISIDERPSIVDPKERLGDWEGVAEFVTVLKRKALQSQPKN